MTKLVTELSPEDITRLIELDRSGRSGYRNYSGKPPQPQALILRRALQLGLPALLEELRK